MRPVTSASNLDRRRLCPGSEFMERGIPEVESEESKEGTLLHAYDANPQFDRCVLKPQQRDLLRISSELDKRIFDLVQEQFGVGQSHYETGREKDLIVDGGSVATPGRCDLWAYWPEQKLMLVVDKKYGFKVVTPAFANIQLRTYAVGAANERDCEHVVVAITQPRLSYNERITMAAYTRQDIEAAHAEILSIRRGSAREDAPLVAGEDQCRYCKAKLVCQAYRDKFALSPVDMNKLQLCTDDQLDMMFVACQFADWVKEPLHSEMRKRKNAGGMANYKLGKEKEVRHIADPNRAFSLLQLRGDLTRDEVFDCSKMFIGKIEERIREKKKLTAKDAKARVNETLESVIERVSERAPLIRLKDKAPKVIEE
jgi:hypothetical protein